MQKQNNSITQQMRIRFYVMNLIYHNSGRSVRVPSTRELSKQFGIARSTVQLAFEELLKDGYLISRQGAATMTNPLSHFILQPQTRNPLIGIKLYEGDAFYYGANFWRAISSVATELTERSFNIRLLMNAATTAESIEREIQESYLDGIILIDSSPAYLETARRQLPCVAIGNLPRPDLPAYIQRSKEKAILKLAGILRERNCLRGLDLVNNINAEDEFHVRKQLLRLCPGLTFTSFNVSSAADPLPAIRKRILRNPPDVILHYEQYAACLQQLLDECGADTLLVSRKAPARNVRYHGICFEFPICQIAQTAVDMLESLLSGGKPQQQIVEAELKNGNNNSSQRKDSKCTT